MRKTTIAGSSLVLMAGLFTAAYAATLEDVSVGHKSDVTRVKLTFDSAPKTEQFLLSSPPRAVIDMRSTQSSWAPKNRVGGPRIKQVRTAHHRNGKLRLVLDLAPGAYWAGLTRVSDNVLVARIKGRPAGLGQTSGTAPHAITKTVQETAYTAAPATRPAVVVVDPGHGGHDPGAIGVDGVVEAEIVLDIARLTAEKLNNRPGIKAVLTRRSDVYLSLAQRRRIAQKRHADLFVSIHANSYPEEQSVNGAAVYVLSRHGASNAKARQLARIHNDKNPQVAGIEFSSENEVVNQVLVDLFQNDAINAAYNLANALIGQLDQTVPIYRRDPLRANFAVLRNPLVPSVLVETAFLSNPKQARKLQTHAYKAEIAEAIADGVDKYFERYPPMRKYAATDGVYIVKAGDTLSEIAAQHGTTAANLKQLNELDSVGLEVGQKLRLAAARETSQANESDQPTVAYTVQKGDTLWRIANDFNTKVDQIVAINDLNDPTLFVGQKLAIPKAGTAERIVVHSGDTLWTIAKNHGTSIKRLKRYNDLNDNQIVQGQVLWLPATSTRSS